MSNLVMASAPFTLGSHQEHELLQLSFHHSFERWLHSSEKTLDVVGTTSVSVLAAAILHPYSARIGPHLVILPRQENIKQWTSSLSFFCPQVQFFSLPSFDVDVYSNLYPHRRVLAQRIRWLFQAQNALPGQIFVATQEALLQKTLPFKDLHQALIFCQVGHSIPPLFSQLLLSRGYTASPLVEDVGTFAFRGGIVDVFSPAYDLPVRMELFGDQIESLRLFDPETQRSQENIKTAYLLPASEILLTEDGRQRAAQMLKSSFADRPIPKEDAFSAVQTIAQGHHLHGMEFLISYFYPQPSLPLEHFSQPVVVWQNDPLESTRLYDQFIANLNTDFASHTSVLIRPQVSEVFATESDLHFPDDSKIITFNPIQILKDQQNVDASAPSTLDLPTSELKEFSNTAKALVSHTTEFVRFLETKLSEWKNKEQVIFIGARTTNQCQRLRLLLERTSFRGHLIEETDYNWNQWIEDQRRDEKIIHLIPRFLPETLRLQNDGIIFLRDEDLFGRKIGRREPAQQKQLEVQTKALNFADLKPGDLIVHSLHGIGVYEGLKVMSIQNVEAELIQLRYKDNDRLYLPVFRVHQIHKFSGPAGSQALNKLGGPSWEKVKSKVRNYLRDIASELLRLYAERAQFRRPPFPSPHEDDLAFASSFPFEETEDQLKCIQDILKDFASDRPMDRLICGDVGFGKTEVALRAAFKVIQDRRQVAVIAPTTVLTFQHTETFKRRFKDWPVHIRPLNRFVSKEETRETLAGLKKGEIDIVIGTHRLLSRDVSFKNLGLLIVDEEQKFGVQHKEKLRKLRMGVDTLTLSATPIPRTLNQSLMGLRDLSIINTPPADRLPTRTFVCKYDPDVIRRALLNEVNRGGQVFFIHNRIESLYGLLDDLRKIVPEVKMALAHGQMEEHELEKVMISFFHHEIDVLVCTTIVESGMDIPNANTMFIDKAHQLGLSQLYQLRGRVGRSKERAYCYLLIPPDRPLDKEAQERLKILQENTALGSGIRIAQYDLELRGAGDLLGEEQSGHINSVGYEMYLELLEEAVQHADGSSPVENASIEPDINIRIPALIPDSYIADIRIRLSYYRAMNDIQSVEDMDRLELDLRDQFGSLPEPVINLMGLMLIRYLCKKLAVRDVSSSKNGISLLFTEKTPLSTTKVVELTRRENKKYSLTPDQRLHIRMTTLSWLRVHEELIYLLSLL